MEEDPKKMGFQRGITRHSQSDGEALGLVRTVQLRCANALNFTIGSRLRNQTTYRTCCHYEICLATISFLALLPAPQRGDRMLRPSVSNIYTESAVLQPFVLDAVIGVGRCRSVYQNP